MRSLSSRRHEAFQVWDTIRVHHLPYAAGIWFSLFKNGRMTLENSAMERKKEDRMERDTEALRKELLDEACAGAFSGLGAMILDADEIQNADGSKLEEIARRYGK